MEAIVVNIALSAAITASLGIYRQKFCLSAIIPISPVNRNKNIYFSFFFGYFDEEKPDICQFFRYFSHIEGEFMPSTFRVCFLLGIPRYFFSRVSEFFSWQTGSLRLFHVQQQVLRRGKAASEIFKKSPGKQYFPGDFFYSSLLSALDTCQTPSKIIAVPNRNSPLNGSPNNTIPPNVEQSVISDENAEAFATLIRPAA